MDVRLRNTELYLDGFIDKMIDFTRLELDRSRDRGGLSSKINDLGALSQSLKKSIDKKGGLFSMTGLDYAHAVDSGTSGGSFPNLDKLVGWVSRKVTTLKDHKGNSIPRTEKNLKRVAYAIGSSIQRNGIKATNFLSIIVEQKMNELISELPEQVVVDVQENLEDIMLKAGYVKKGNTYELKG